MCYFVLLFLILLSTSGCSSEKVLEQPQAIVFTKTATLVSVQDAHEFTVSENDIALRVEDKNNSVYLIHSNGFVTQAESLSYRRLPTTILVPKETSFITIDCTQKVDQSYYINPEVSEDCQIHATGGEEITYVGAGELSELYSHNFCFEEKRFICGIDSSVDMYGLPRTLFEFNEVAFFAHWNDLSLSYEGFDITNKIGIFRQPFIATKNTPAAVITHYQYVAKNNLEYTDLQEITKINSGLLNKCRPETEVRVSSWCKY